MKVGTEIDEKTTAGINSVLSGSSNMESCSGDGVSAANALNSIKEMESMANGGYEQNVSTGKRQITWETLAPHEMFNGLKKVAQTRQAEYDSMVNNRTDNIEALVNDKRDKVKSRRDLWIFLNNLGFIFARILFGVAMAYKLKFKKIILPEAGKEDISKAKNEKIDRQIDAAFDKLDAKIKRNEANNKGSFTVIAVFLIRPVIVGALIAYITFLLPVLYIFDIFFVVCLIICRFNLALKFNTKIIASVRTGEAKQQIEEQYDEDLVQRKEYIEKVLDILEAMERAATERDEDGGIYWEGDEFNCKDPEDYALLQSLKDKRCVVTSEDRKAIVKEVIKASK